MREELKNRVDLPEEKQEQAQEILNQQLGHLKVDGL
jgi:hypothetical protein